MVDCMVATKTPVPNAERLAANLLAADYRGHFSHGLNRLAMYVKERSRLSEFPKSCFLCFCGGFIVMMLEKS